MGLGLLSGLVLGASSGVAFTRYPKGYRPAKYSFKCRLTGRRLPCHSKYMPHQGEREMARRRAKIGAI